MKFFNASLLVIIALVCHQQRVNAQTKIKDGTVTGSSSLPNANAILELESNNKGFLLPRVALDSTLLATPLSANVAGMTVYNTATAHDVTPGYYYNDGTKWVKLNQDYKEPWRVMGTTNLADSNTQNIYQMGKVGIGINPGTTPVANLQIYENSTTGGSTNLLSGINSIRITNKEGGMYGIYNSLTDKATAGSGLNSIFGVYSQVIDSATVQTTGAGAYFNYNLSGTKDNGSGTHLHGLRNQIKLDAIGGNLTSGFSYANYAYASSNALSGNVNLGSLRAYSGYVYPSVYSGNTLASQSLMGVHSAVRPQLVNGTINVGSIDGVSGQVEPDGASGTLNISGWASGLRSLINMTGSATYNINNLYGIYVDKFNAGTNGTINRAIGLYIKPFLFPGASTANSYNIYSEGDTTKNYFGGKVGIGIKNPGAELHIVKKAADLTPAIIEGCADYAGNAAAVAAGLPVGALYRTGDVLKIVH
ncbi:MAG: hypothetical protein JST36_06555 [Bacteroidetes bacterium]|nr:hypothetical protein [Bacteroidota bacterium]